MSNKQFDMSGTFCRVALIVLFEVCLLVVWALFRPVVLTAKNSTDSGVVVLRVDHRILPDQRYWWVRSGWHTITLRFEDGSIREIRQYMVFSPLDGYAAIEYDESTGELALIYG